MCEETQPGPGLETLLDEALEGLPPEVRGETLDWINRASTAPAGQIEREVVSTATSCQEKFSLAAAAVERLIAP